MIVYSLFVMTGILLMAGAIASLKRRLAFVKTGERVVGKVIRVVESEDSSDGTYFYPVYEINTRQNGAITYRPDYSSSFSRWKPGETETFIIAPGDPGSVRPLRYWQVFWWPLGLMAVAVNLVIIGSGYFLMYAFFGGKVG